MKKPDELKSAVYTGWVRHRRFMPRSHAFRYRVFMMYLDLDEMETVFSLSPLWSLQKPAPARFRREDYFGDPSVPLANAVKDEIKEKLNIEITGAVRVLTNLRYFGFIINPLTVYYCFDHNDQLQAMLLEVTNTPWNERHAYALQCDPTSRLQRKTFGKAHHVSPFMPMNMRYQWNSNLPTSLLTIHMINQRIEDGNQCDMFDATMILKRKAISPGLLNSIPLRHPFMTLKVFLAIYWQALKLFVKKIPFYHHPKTDNVVTTRH